VAERATQRRRRVGIRLAFSSDTVRFVNQSDAIPVTPLKGAAVLFVRGNACPKENDKSSCMDIISPQTGFEGEDRHDGVASRFFTRKRNGRSAAVTEYTYTVFGLVRPPSSSCIFPVFNKKAPPVRASSSAVAVPPGRRSPVAQSFPYAAPASPGDQSGSRNRYCVEVELHGVRSAVHSPATPPPTRRPPGS
jgi:hypothetical protein